MNDEIKRRLESWGSAPTPDVDPLFAERLDADLRSAAYFAPTPEPDPRRRLIMRPAFVLAGLVLVAAIATVAVGLWDTDNREVLVLGDASSSSVTVPGQTAMPAEAGAALPDGTIIDVGPGGFALVSGVVIPADTRALVVDGHVELLEPEVAIAPTPTATPTPTDRTDGRVATPSPERTATTRPTPALTPASTPVTPDVPPPTARPTSTPTERAEPTPTATPETEPTATAEPTATPSPQPPSDEPADIVVTLQRSNLGPNRAVLTWAPTATEGIRGWEVRVRRGDTVRTVAVLRRRGARELVVERPDVLRIFYTVAALDADGGVLAVSNEVRVPSAN